MHGGRGGKARKQRLHVYQTNDHMLLGLLQLVTSTRTCQCVMLGDHYHVVHFPSRPSEVRGRWYPDAFNTLSANALSISHDTLLITDLHFVMPTLLN